MRTAKYLNILFLLLATTLLGCSKEENGIDDNKLYDISLRFNGEISTSESPLMRGEATNDLYGVNVYKDDKYYAYGLFDNVDAIRIYLPAGSTYKFEATIVKDEKNIIRRRGWSDGSYEYYAPFTIADTYYNDSESIMCENEFKSCRYDSYTSHYEYLNGLKFGKTAVYTDADKTKYKITSYPQTDRFYGELDKFTPSADATVDIDMKRTAFGLQYQVNGVSDGTVSIKIKNDSETFVDNTSITSDYTSQELIYTFSDVYSAWKYSDNYTENVTVSASWLRGIGITQDLGSKVIQIKRNRMNIVRIKLATDESGNSVGIEVESETPMTNENITIPLG